MKHTIRKIAVLLFIVFFSGIHDHQVHAQTTVFSADFATPNSTTWITNAAIASSVWRANDIQQCGSRISGGQLHVTNKRSSSFQHGQGFASTDMSAFAAPYNTTLSSNGGLVTWTFNMQMNFQAEYSSTPLSCSSSSSQNGKIAMAFILAANGNATVMSATGNCNQNGTADGYAVIIPSSGSGNLTPKLVRFTNGIYNGSIADIASWSASIARTRYMSFMVTYNPANNAWTLQVRNDSASAFSDPDAGTYGTAVSGTDATYTGQSLTYMGGYMHAGCTGLCEDAGYIARFDNVKVKTVGCTAPAAPPAMANISVGPVAGVNGTALLPDASITANSCFGGCTGGGHESYRGRLFNQGAGTLAWASQNNNLNNTEYLQFDLGSVQQVKGVATQGRGDCCAQLVSSYQVQYSEDGASWTTVPGTFTGNADQHTVVTNTFTPVIARYVRIYPQAIGGGHMSMRADVLVVPCVGGTVSMSAGIPANATTIRWYDVATGGTALATGQYFTTPALSASKVYYAESYNGTCASTTRTAVTAEVANGVTLDGITVSSNCWFTNNANDYTITAKATGISPSGIGGPNYGIMALINYQGTNAPNYGGYFAWNKTQALLTASGFTSEQQACAGGGWIGKSPGYGASVISLISGSTSVSGNQRTVNFVVRPNATFPQFLNNSISEYAQSSNGCQVGWTEYPNLFTSSPPIALGTVTVNGNSTLADLVEVCPGQTINISQSGFTTPGATTYFYSDNTTGLGGWAVVPEWEIISNGSVTAANQVAGQASVNNLSGFKYKINNPGTYIFHTNANYGNCYGVNGVNRYISVTSPTAPATITPATLAVCAGAPAALTASGGTTGSDDVYIWQAGACNIAYEQNWKDQPFSAPNTTVNAVNGILNLTSTSNDAMLDMGGLGSFSPLIYRYINIRYRVTAGTAGNVEIFFYNASHAGAAGGETGLGSLISDGAWHILTIDMHQDPDYLTGGNITGWRYDWCTANGVTMDLDFISLDQHPILAEGASYTPSPAVATTYYASKRSDCGATSCISRTVTINTIPSQPSVIAGTPGLCLGTSQAFSVTSAGGVTYTWSYSGTGTVTPGSNTCTLNATAGGTLTCTPSNACGSGTAQALAITIGAPSVAPASVNGGGTYCHGNQVTLTQSGGSLSTGADYQWFTGSCGGSLVGTGSSITVTPSATTTYYVRAGAGTFCPATTCGSGAVTLPPVGTNISGTSTATCPVRENSWINFYNSSGLLIGAVNSGGLDLGNVTMSVNVGGAGAMHPCNSGSNPAYQTAYMGRNWIMRSTNYAGTDFPSAVQIRLPFSSTELTAMNSVASSVTTGNGMDNNATAHSVMLTKFTATSSVNEDNDPTNNCGTPGTIRGISQSGNNSITVAYPELSAAVGSYVQFGINQFSEMFLNSGGAGSPLPVSLTSFAAVCNEINALDVNWSTASEHNSHKFMVEKSRDLQHWLSVSEVPAAGSSAHNINYSAADSNPFAGTSYYRLVQLDINGAEKIYGPVSVSCAGQENSMIVFPNPANGAFTVEVSSAEFFHNAEMQLTDVTGKLISSRKLNVIEGKNQFIFERDGLEMGTYLIHIITGHNTFNTVKIVLN